MLKNKFFVQWNTDFVTNLHLRNLEIEHHPLRKFVNPKFVLVLINGAI